MKTKTLPAKTNQPRFEWWIAPNGRYYMHRKHRNGNITDSNNYASLHSVRRRCQRLAPAGFVLVETLYKKS